MVFENSAVLWGNESAKLRPRLFQEAPRRDFRKGRSRLSIPIEILGVSTDTPHGPLTLEVVSVHSVAVNCADEKKRRWTLITSNTEFQPRSILVSRLPPLRQREIISADAAAAPRLFEPRIRGKTRISEKWTPLLLEWADFIREPDLAALGREMEENGLSGLSGMGPGFTPAGDDYLCGWITAMRAGGLPETRRGVDDFLRAWKPEKTTWFSKWMLLDAIQGKIWKRGKELLSALGQDDAGALMSAASEILNWGHTSGQAWLAGLARGVSGSRR